MGQGFTEIRLRRVSGAPCRLDDTVTRLSAATPSGTREDLPTEALRFRVDDQPIELRAAGDSGEIALGYYTRCGSEVATDDAGHTTYAPPSRPPLRNLVLELGSGGPLPVASGPLYIGCLGQKVQVSRVGGPPYEAQYADLGLDATISAADHATAGQPFSYVVTLHNRTDKDFPLSPCPNYSQTTKLETETPTDHALNCAASRPIPAGGSESFAMTIPIPATTQAYASLIWRLHTGGTESILASNTLALEGPTGGEPRQCVASQLAATLDGVDRATAFEYSSVTIRRVSGEPCSLRDDVKGIYGVFDGGEPIALATTPAPDQQAPATVVLAGPDDAASFEIAVMARCANGPTQPRSSPARSLRLMLNPAGDLAVLTHNEAGGLNYGCLPHEGRIYVRTITKAR